MSVYRNGSNVADLHLSPSNRLNEYTVQQLAESLRATFQQLKADLPAFGPRRLADTLEAAVHWTLQYYETARRSAHAPGVVRALLDRVFARVLASLHDACTELVHPPGVADFPYELIPCAKDWLHRFAALDPKGTSVAFLPHWPYYPAILRRESPLEELIRTIEADYHLTLDSTPAKRLARERKELPTLFHLISFPQAEGRNVLFHPLFLHEFGHAIDWERGISASVLKVVDSGISSDEAETVENWIGELVADALAIRLSGPCVVFALWQSSLIANVMDQDSRTHPSTRLRLAVGIAQLSGLGYVSLDEESIGAEADGATCPLDIEAVLHLLWPGCRRELTASSEEYHGGFRRERAAVLAKAVLASLQQQVDSACPEPFDADMYKQTVKPLVDHLRNGRPPIPPAEASSPLPAVFNAVWEIAECHKAEIFQGFRFTKLSDLAASLRSLSELALKGIEAWHVRHSWSRGRARRAKRLRTGVQEVNRAVLSWATLRARLDKDLFVEPILDEKSQLGHGSIDLRLGTQFIVTRLGDLSHFDPTEMRETEIRRFQENVSKSFGETFVCERPSGP